MHLYPGKKEKNSSAFATLSLNSFWHALCTGTTNQIEKAFTPGISPTATTCSTRRTYPLLLQAARRNPLHGCESAIYKKRRPFQVPPKKVELPVKLSLTKISEPLAETPENTRFIVQKDLKTQQPALAPPSFVPYAETCLQHSQHERVTLVTSTN